MGRGPLDEEAFPRGRIGLEDDRDLRSGAERVGEESLGCLFHLLGSVGQIEGVANRLEDCRLPGSLAADEAVQLGVQREPHAIEEVAIPPDGEDVAALVASAGIAVADPRPGIQEGLSQSFDADGVHLDPRRLGPDGGERACVGGEQARRQPVALIVRILTADDAPIAAFDLIGRLGGLNGRQCRRLPEIHAGTRTQCLEQTLVALYVRGYADATAVLLDEGYELIEGLVAPKLESTLLTLGAGQPESGEHLVQVMGRPLGVKQAEDVNALLALHLEARQEVQTEITRRLAQIVDP